MMSSTCNMNCYCPNSDCNYKHCIDFKDRKVIIKMIEKTPSIKSMKEDKNPNRKANCTFGILCYKENCNYKHYYNDQARQIIIKKFNEYQENFLKKENQQPKEVKIKDIDYKSVNKYDFLTIEEEELPIFKGVSYASMVKR